MRPTSLLLLASIPLALAPPAREGVAHAGFEVPPAAEFELEPSAVAAPPTLRAIPGAWLVEHPTVVPCDGGPALATAVRQAEAFTLTAWVEPGAPLVGPGLPEPASARLLAFGTGERSRNLAVDVTADGATVTVQWFVRTTETSAEGNPRHSASFPRPTRPFHLALVRTSDGIERLAVDGREVAALPRAGSLGAWDQGAALCLFGEHDAYRPWRGALHHMAVVPGAASAAQVAALAARGPEVPELGWLDTEPAGLLSLDVAGEHLAGDTQIGLVNRGRAALRWRAELVAAAPWCHLAGPLSGELAPGARTTVRLAVERGSLPTEGMRSAGALHFECESGGATERLVRSFTASWTPAGEGWPNAADTGPRRPPLEARAAGFTVRAGGAVLECLAIDGPLLIDADDVLLRDLTIDAGTARYGLRIAPGRKNVRIERTLVRGGVEATLAASGAWLSDVRIEAGPGYGALLGSDVSLQRVWIDAAGPGQAAVALCGGEGVDLVEVRIDADPARAAALALTPDRGAVRGVSIERSWLGGGQITLLATAGLYGSPEGVTLLGNRLTQPAAEAAVSLVGADGWRAERNVFAATGTPLALP